MNRSELTIIANDTAGLYTSDQKAKARAALAEYEAPKSSDGFTTLYGEQPVYPSGNRHFSIRVESSYADELLKTRSMDDAAKQAANDCLLLGLRAKHDKDAEALFCKRFAENAYHLIRVE